MILTGLQITEEWKKGTITIKPFIESNINPNSYNYRIGNFIKESLGDNQFKNYRIPREGFLLKPHTLYLANTIETIGSHTFSVSLIGRSSIGRLGLFLQHSANLGHVGSIHRWTLELMSAKAFMLYPKMVIGQVSFWVNFGERKPYVGNYGFKSEVAENENYSNHG